MTVYNSNIRNLNEHPEDWEFFACVIDGEVAVLAYYNKDRHPAQIAAFSSNPTIVKIDDELKLMVKPGWTFDGTNFTPPQ